MKKDPDMIQGAIAIHFLILPMATWLATRINRYDTNLLIMIALLVAMCGWFAGISTYQYLFHWEGRPLKMNLTVLLGAFLIPLYWFLSLLLSAMCISLAKRTDTK